MGSSSDFQLSWRNTPLQGCGKKNGETATATEEDLEGVYLVPAKEGDTAKYPLVVWLHGMGDGFAEGKLLESTNISYWTSDEFQSRFGQAGGAFILAARSREEDNIFWSNEMIEPLRAAIDEFIAQNKENIDLTRIYVGGYSMGGKMTLKIAVAYPDMFAAIFPVCPAWVPDSAAAKSSFDVLRLSS
mgnify:CR=1 FL=1